MKIGLSSLLFPRVSVEEALSCVNILGANCVEIIFENPHFPPEFNMKRLRGLRKLIDSYDLDVSIHSPYGDINPASYYSEVRALALKQTKRSIDACCALGGDIVVMHVGRCPTPEIENLLSMSKILFLNLTSECLNYAKKRDVKLTLENFPIPIEYPYSHPKQLIGLARKMDGLGITYDVGHAFIEKRRGKMSTPEQKIVEDIKLFGKFLSHVHFHDNHGTHDEHLPLGDGDINFKPIIEALKETNYGGKIILEVWHPRLKRPMKVGRIGLKNVREILKAS